jgi:hypothetical protein
VLQSEIHSSSSAAGRSHFGHLHHNLLRRPILPAPAGAMTTGLVSSVSRVLAAGGFADHGSLLVVASQGLYQVQMHP